MQKYRADRKVVPQGVEKICVCGRKFYVAGQGKGKSKYCLECKTNKILGRKLEFNYEN
jgi:hypothetical protein